MAANVAMGARSWNPEFTHSDRERWICIYPAYLNSRKTVAEGRQICKTKAVDNPLPGEIRDVLTSTGLMLGVENKLYPREVDRNCRGRIRVQLKNDDGSPVQPQFPTRRALLEYIAETIPKLKTRGQGSAAVQQAASASASNTSTGGGGKKKQEQEEMKRTIV